MFMEHRVYDLEGVFGTVGSFPDQQIARLNQDTAVECDNLIFLNARF
ncbi:Unknown protein sequence [Pseudomonas syringae pv. maculicola]|nr:Unknown protein sequence [Pseudomonas syringae pv. maculicola]